MNYISIRISADNLNLEKINYELNFDNSVICKKGNTGEYKGEKFTFAEDVWQSKIEVTDDDLIENLSNERTFVSKANMYNNSDNTDYQVGDIVIHEMFGRGVVVGVDKTLISIAFGKQYGIKKLMKNHKSLRKVS